jgi:Holliday junction resolvase-like predicted endonuclease
VSRNRAKGTAAETAVVAYLRDQGATQVERRALAGALDRGDIAGLPGVCVEVKNHQHISLAEFVDEAVAEGVNAGADVALAWIKRRGKGSPADWFVAMTGAQAVALLRAAGYIPDTTRPE